MSLSDDTTMEVLSGLRRRVDVDAASRLRLDDDVVYTVVFRRLHDGVPFVLTRVHLPEPVARPCSTRPSSGDGAGEHAAPSSGCSSRISTTPSPKRPSRSRWRRPTMPWRSAVGCVPGHPMLRVDRLYSDASGTPVELAVSHFLPEQYTYRVTLRRSS